MTLYEITQDMQALDELMSCDDMTAENSQDILKYLNENTENLNKKLEGYGKYIRGLEAESKALKEEEERLYTHRKVTDNKIESMKNQLKYYLNSIGIEKINAGIFNISIRKNPESLKITGEVTKEYYIPQPDKIDNAKIKEELKSGKELPFATLERSESIIIK